MVPVVTYLIFLLTCRPWGFFPLHLDLIFLLHYVLEYVIQFSFPCLPCSLLISGVKHFKGTLINLNFKNTFGFKKIEWEVLLHIFSLLSPTLLISLYCLYIVLVWYICCNWWINNDILLSIHFIVYGSVHFFLCADTCMPCIHWFTVMHCASHPLPYSQFLAPIGQLTVSMVLPKADIFFFAAMFFNIYRICIWFILLFFFRIPNFMWIVVLMKKKCSHRLMCLDTCSPGFGTVWGT